MRIIKLIDLWDPTQISFTWHKLKVFEVKWSLEDSTETKCTKNMLLSMEDNLFHKCQSEVICTSNLETP